MVILLVHEQVDLVTNLEKRFKSASDHKGVSFPTKPLKCHKIICWHAAYNPAMSTLPSSQLFKSEQVLPIYCNHANLALSAAGDRKQPTIGCTLGNDLEDSGQWHN